MKAMRALSVKGKIIKDFITAGFSIAGYIIATLLCLSWKLLEIYAAVPVDPQSKGTEIVFLLDTSESMNKQDKERAAIDAVRQMSYSLPSNYKVGLVAYHTEIQSVIPLSTDMELLNTALEDIDYTGYTNAGDGLEEAVKLFSGNEEADKYIIMISDGEIDMQDSQQREVSRTAYVEAADRAREQDIEIIIAAIGTEMNAEMHIFDGAQLTGGAIYWEGQLGGVAQIMERILTDRIFFPRQEAGVTDAGAGSIRMELPVNADRVKVMITGSTELTEVWADYAAESGSTIAGKRFAAVEMERPSSAM